jgi:transmembrane sensor
MKTLEDKYGSFESISDDKDFIRWVNSGFQHQSEKWAQFQKDNPHLEKEIADAIILIQKISADKKTRKNTGVQNEIWTQIEKDILAPSKKYRKLPFAQMMMRIAAIFGMVIMAGVYLYIQSPDNVRIIAEKQHLKKLLPDNSTVIISQNSGIELNSKEWKKGNKHLHLKGEAYFDVVKNSKFVVGTIWGEVEVLGTQFNVKSGDFGLSVYCESGTVQVVQKDRRFILQANDYLSFNALSETYFQKNNPDYKPEWPRNIRSYQAQSLIEVFEDISRHFDVEISYPADQGLRKFTGNVEMAELHAALEVVCWPMQLQFAHKENDIQIFSLIPE